MTPVEIERRAAERRQSDRRAAPSHATDRERTLIKVIDDLLDPEPEDRFTEGLNQGLLLIRSAIRLGIEGEGR